MNKEPEKAIKHSMKIIPGNTSWERKMTTLATVCDLAGGHWVIFDTQDHGKCTVCGSELFYSWSN